MRSIHPHLRWLLLLAVCQAAVSMTTPANAADKADASRSFDLTYTLKLTDLPTDGSKVEAWIPFPQTTDWQMIRGYLIDPLQLEAQIGGQRLSWSMPVIPNDVVREPKFGNEFLHFDLTAFAANAPNHELDLPVHFYVVRLKHEPLKEDNGVVLDRAELARWLQPDSKVPTTGKVADEAQATAGGDADQIDAARKLYDHIVATVKYDKPKDKAGWGQGDAVWACDNRFGNCTDFHSLFIGEARSLNIPARFRIGIPLPFDKTEGEIGGYHCWAEFYVPGHGWVPIDASEAQKDNSRINELFGSLDASRVEFTMGRDFDVPGTHHGQFNYFIYPYAEVNGTEWKGVGRAFTFKDM